jgi:HlyD family secretion protein
MTHIALSWFNGGEDGVRSQLTLALAGVLVMVGGVGGWAAVTPLSGAVIAPATVVVDSNVKKVQHQTGGIVGEIRVKDGDHVHAGDVLLRLDETVARANLQITSKQLDQFAAREARLLAERDGLDAMVVSPTLQERMREPDFALMFADERRLFENRRSARDGLKNQLGERVAQLSDEIVGIEAQLTAKERETSLIREELKGVRELYRKNLLPLTRVNALDRDAARIEGERGQLLAAVAQAKGKISETRLQILQIDRDLKTEVGKDLREQQAKQAELVERRIAADDQLRRVDIRSPQTGIVHQLSVHTVGGVVSPGEPIMLVVPEGEQLVLEAKVSPQEIDHVQVGQPAIVRMTAFNQRTTPEFRGEVSYVAADLTKDQQQNQAWFVARIRLESDELHAALGARLVPGMPAEVHLQTGDRTALSYFLKPLSDQVSRAFKER